MPRSVSLLLALVLVLPGCTGNIADLFDLFPEDVFQDDAGGGGGIPPGGGGGGFQASEVAFLAGAHGVTGDVRNIALAQVGAQTLAFLAAGTDGCHIVDVAQPELVNSTDYITTVSDAVLTAPAAIAGGRVDAIAVVDNTFLVCVAVGAGGANSVSVFNIPLLLGAATTPTADLSAAFVPLVGPGIAVPGNSGKGGGVDGASGFFLVATGGASLGVGSIAIDGSAWSATLHTPTDVTVDSFVDVRLNGLAIYASVQTGTTFGIIAFAINAAATPPELTLTTPEIVALLGNFELVVNDIITGPGNFPLDLAHDGNSLFVTGENEVHVFNVTIPVSPSRLATVERTGLDTIAVSGSGGFFAVGTGDSVRVYSILTGQPTLTSVFGFDNGFFIRGVALHSSAAGRFALCCAGERGLRIVQWSNIP